MKVLGFLVGFLVSVSVYAQKVNFARHGIYRVAAVSPKLVIGNPEKNAEEIIRQARIAAENHALVIGFPEMAMLGYTIEDLVFSPELLKETTLSILKIMRATEGSYPEDRALKGKVLIVGGPFEYKDVLYNVAYVIRDGKLLMVVPKSYLPNYKEFHDKRWFTTGKNVHTFTEGRPLGKFFFGRRGIVEMGPVKLAVEICEDLWSPIPPSRFHGLNGANLIVNPSASPDFVAKHGYRTDLVATNSASIHAAYLYASSGVHESTKDLVFGGSTIIAEDGIVLANGPRFQRESVIIYGDVDFEKLKTDRLIDKTFADAQQDLPESEKKYATINAGDPLEHYIEAPSYSLPDLKRTYSKTPFIPESQDKLNEYAEEVFMIQSSGLMTAVEEAGVETLLEAISGGSDSTIAALVAMDVAKKKGWAPSRVIGVTMPGLGTSARTKENAHKLMKALGMTVEEKSIAEPATDLILSMAGVKTLDAVNDQEVFYGNTQARLRTAYVMGLANHKKGMMVGTGDLSEIWLGWSTFAGDHISNYNVNAGVPKTLVKHLIRWYVHHKADAALKQVLLDILDTPDSPELEKLGKDGKIAQKTEELVGPYKLHDFFLYHHIRHRFGPKKIFDIATHVFKDEYKPVEIKKWLGVFFKRGYTQAQFKRNVFSAGPKVGSVALSPRGDWRAPTSMDCEFWTKIIDRIQVE